MKALLSIHECFFIRVQNAGLCSSQYSCVASNYTSEEITCSTDPSPERQLGPSEQINDHLFPKGPNEHHKAYSKCSLALFPLISATHFLLRALKTSVEKGFRSW